ncbi:hypothetical protein GCM10023097_70470 [Streptomyces collinus]
MGAGVQVRPGPDAHPGGGGEHHRGQQDDGRVQTEHGRDDGRQCEHRGEQPGGAPGGPAGHPRPAGREQSLDVTEVGEYQHGREEADHRPQPLDLLPGVLRRDHAEGEGESCGRHRQHGLGQALRAGDGPDQHGGQQRHGQDFGEQGVQSEVLRDAIVRARS